MSSNAAAPVKLRAKIEKWPLLKPFNITGYTFHAIDVLHVCLERNGRLGRAEAAGVYYKNDGAVCMLQQIEGLRETIESGIDRRSLQQLLPPGGARNALDCALWDLEAKLTGRSAWQLADLPRPRSLITTFTCGVAAPEAMAAAARAYIGAQALKLKLTGDPLDADRVCAVRDARPDVWLSVDANQGFSRGFLERLMPLLVEKRVSLIEQPFPVADDALLEGFQSPISIAADESVQSLPDITFLLGRFDVVNIKLDKCGGLTEALAMARLAREHGLETMVGNMSGTSLAMAPAFLLGQLCDVVDLDGPAFLAADREVRADYSGGYIRCPEQLWGGPPP